MAFLIDRNENEMKFYSLLRKISECDLVITIANFTTQLSGSMGIPTWVLLPYSCHWRWFVNRTNSLWYPSVKLFRQKKWNDWNGVINDVSKSLKNFK